MKARLQPAKREMRLFHVPCIFLLCVSCAKDGAEPHFTLKQVGPNVWAAISNPKSKAPAGANTGFVIGDDGVAVIDTTASVDTDGNFVTEPAKELLATIRKLTKLPIRFVINTHHHLDHVGANWDSFNDLARPNILDTDAELSGKKRIPQAQPTK